MTPRRWARLLALLVATQAVALVFPWAAWVMIVAAVIGFAWSWRAAAKAVYRADDGDRPRVHDADQRPTPPRLVVVRRQAMSVSTEHDGGLHLRRRGDWPMRATFGTVVTASGPGLRHEGGGIIATRRPHDAVLVAVAMVAWRPTRPGPD
jgi:hypothetical protein